MRWDLCPFLHDSYHRSLHELIKSLRQGDVIKEGQVIGWLDQFGTELPVKVGSSIFL